MINLEEKKLFTIFVGDSQFIHEAVSLEEAEKKAKEVAERLGATRYTVFEEKLWKVI